MYFITAAIEVGWRQRVEQFDDFVFMNVASIYN